VIIYAVRLGRVAEFAKMVAESAKSFVADTFGLVYFMELY
jgi:hypothetical protein